MEIDLYIGVPDILLVVIIIGGTVYGVGNPTLLDIEQTPPGQMRVHHLGQEYSYNNLLISIECLRYRLINGTVKIIDVLFKYIQKPMITIRIQPTN